MLSLLSGAETLFEQESCDAYGERLAPERASSMHHGHALFFRTRMAADGPVRFPRVPWATEVSKDLSDLRGQLREPGIENGPGPGGGA